MFIIILHMLVVLICTYSNEDIHAQLIILQMVHLHIAKTILPKVGEVGIGDVEPRGPLIATLM
jgi:hypothetical protein